MPLLVVPAGLLWEIDYNANGNLVAGPRPVRHAALFLNHAWTVDPGVGRTLSYRLSHIDLVALDALSGVVDSYFGAGGFFAAVKG